MFLGLKRGDLCEASLCSLGLGGAGLILPWRGPGFQVVAVVVVGLFGNSLVSGVLGTVS
jgi:hypothetical protein